MHEEIIAFGQRWGFRNAENSKILIQAFTHKSYKNYSKDFERLEFLGDSILGAVVSNILCKSMPNQDEGLLSRARTNLVNKSSLSSVAKRLNLDKLILMGNNELKLNYNLNDKVLADTYEAFIGALFCENNFESCQEFVESTLNYELNNFLGNLIKKDPKTSLQEFTQLNFNQIPCYEVTVHDYVNNKHFFEVTIKINGKVMGSGNGNDRKSAEQMAASNVLKTLVEI